ncbi:MAG: LysR substrate-binding domain-containing protein [Streptosporangiaceae bacterium]
MPGGRAQPGARRGAAAAGGPGPAALGGPYYRSSPNPSAAPIMHQLALLDIRPRIAVRVESYLAVPHFVAGTDRIALMQERLAARLADRMDLRVLECPGQPDPIVEALWWHRQYEDDTAHAWLRRLITETAGRL